MTDPTGIYCFACFIAAILLYTFIVLRSPGKPNKRTITTPSGHKVHFRTPRNPADVDALAAAIVASKDRGRLGAIVETWLADERPAWETVAAFERDVENALRGHRTGESISAYDNHLNTAIIERLIGGA